MSIKIINLGTDYYLQSLDLRQRVLWDPIQLKIPDDYLDRDKDCVHIAWIVDSFVQGIVLLYNMHSSSAQLFQMAVDSKYQGSGIGKN